MISFNIKVKIAYKEKKGQWEVSTEEPSLKEVSTELPTALRTLQAKLSKALEELPTTNRVILTLNEIKVSGSAEIDYEGLRTGGQVFFDIEDMRVSTSFTVTFSPDRTLASFDNKSVLDEVRDIVNSGAFDKDGVKVTMPVPDSTEAGSS